MRVVVGVLLAVAAAGSAAQQVADIREGTNMAVALAPDGTTLVVDLLGQLWRLPATGGGAEPLTPPDERARNPRISADGATIVYQRLIDGQWDLWLLDVASGGRRALTDTPANEREPDFLPDGSVVFAADTTGRFCLWKLDLETGVKTQLTAEPGDASFPSASERGEIVYVLDRGERYELRVLTERGVSVEIHASGRALAAPTWRPGGDVVVFHELDGARASALKVLVLADLPVVKTLTRAEDVFRARPAWLSPAELLYTADGQIWRRGLAGIGRRPVHLFAAVAIEAAKVEPLPLGVETDGRHRALGIAGLDRGADGTAVFTALGDVWLASRGRLRRLTDDPFVDAEPVLAEQGRSVVFASDRGGRMALWRIDVETGATTPIASPTGNVFHPAVAPDGASVAFLATDGLGPWAASSLGVVSLASGAVTELASGLIEPERPRWEPDARTVTVAARGGTPLPGSGRYVARVEPRDPARGSTSGASVGTPADEPDELPELTWSAPEPAPPYVVEVGRLFDGVGTDYRRHVDIHIENHRIVAIVPRGLRPLPRTVIDARDATVIPGLIDVHAHQSALVGERLGRAWLAYGVTTVREVTDDLASALERGEAWASGRRLGPRLVISPSDGARPAAPLAEAYSPVPIRAFATLADGLGHSLYRQASVLGVPLFGESTPFRALARLGANASPYELELSPLHSSYQDSVGRVIASATVVTPALAALYGLEDWRPRPLNGRGADPAYERLFTAQERQRWQRASLSGETMAALQQTVVQLVRNGGRVAIGTDAPAAPYGLGVHADLARLAAAGLPNDQVLRLATAQGALALGLERDLGTLEPGKLADFVVLSGDPLARIDDTLTITAVVKSGRWIDRDQLLAPP